jgi:selenocysteine-specific translation elongation factor
MLDKPRMIALNKCDLFEQSEIDEKTQKFKEKLHEVLPVFNISGVSGKGLKELKEHIYKTIKQ